MLKIIKQTDKFILLICLAGAGFLLTVFLSSVAQELTGFDFSVIIFSLFVLGKEYLERRKLRDWEQELIDFDRFLTDVRFRFNTHGMIDEAVCDAIEVCGSRKMRNYMEKLYGVLKTEDNGEKAAEYRNSVHNPFFGLFLTLCLTVMEFGDKKDGELSAFLVNIRYLRDEINNEIAETRLRRYSFSGMIPVAVIPVISLRIIESWGVSNVEALYDFYYGRTGDIIRLILFILTVVTYILISELKKYRFYDSKNKPVYSVNLPDWIKKVLVPYIRKHPTMKNKTELLLSECGAGVDFITFFVIRQAMFVLGFMLSLIFCIAYSENGFSAEGALIVPATAFLSYCFPLFFLNYRKTLTGYEIENEAFKFQSVVMILMYSEQMSVYKILEELEAFAVHYKRIISSTINDYQSGENEALRKLKELSECEIMERFTESLIQCTEIGVAESFREIIPERNYYLERRKQKNKINNERKVVLAKVLAFIPLVAIIGGYLIIPFVLESMKTMNGLSL